MADDLARLKAERAQLRRFYTMSAKNVEAELSTDPVDLERVNVEFAKLADKAERLFAMDRRVADVFFGDEKLAQDESETQKEFEGVEVYRDSWVSLTARKNAFAERQRNPETSVDTTSSEKLKLKLPKLDIRKFDIKPQTWISFWASFKKIHEREDLDPEDKFQLLLRMSADGTVARQLLDSFPPSAANYEKALAQLKQRFGRDELLIELYVRELLGIVLAQAKRGGNDKSDLRKLFDDLEARLMALESLGVACDRYACMLLPLVESSLPERVIRDWEKARPSTDQSLVDATAQMEQLRLFLRREVASEERVALARSSFSLSENPGTSKVPQRRPTVQDKRVATAAGLVSLETKETGPHCAFCSNDHFSEYCRRAREMDPDSKMKILREKNLCFRCLKRYHVGRRCRVSLSCLVCSKPHATAMCSEPFKEKSFGQSNEVVKDTEKEVEQNLSNTTRAPVLMQTLKVHVISDGPPVAARVLIDSGSQRSYISSRLAREVGYPALGVEKIAHSLFGGESTGIKTHHRYKVRLRHLRGHYACNFEVLDTEAICHAIPAVTMWPWITELKRKKIFITDTTEGPVDILIGSDVAGKLFTGQREVLGCGLVAMETYLGWTLMGRIRNSESNFMLNVCLCTAELSPSEMWRLDVLGIDEPADITTQEEAKTAACEHFLKTVKILDSGRYEVSLPWLVGHPPLPSGFQQATIRLESTVKKLRSNCLFNEYNDVLSEWLQEGVIEEVDQDKWDCGHYLPHRAVVKEGSTTRVRPVFDASAGRPNLNQCLEKGDNLIELIPSILLRFRLRELGVISDIRRAFLQISVNEADRDYLRFLWVDSSGMLRIFRHKRVVFGVTSSPYLLASVINHHLSLCEAENTRFESSTISQLRESFYVDNCVTSVDSEDVLKEFVTQSKAIFSQACFDLRGWEWTDSTLANETKTPVLGLLWNRKSDGLKVNLPQFDYSAEVTRRTVLSACQKIFDPIGVYCPTTLLPRLIIQESWKSGGTWDTPLPEKSRVAFVSWMSEVADLDKFEIPRWVKASVCHSDVTLHTFCDASKVAFATVSFLRVETSEGVSVTLLAAKSRVAPMKKITIPRLELLAAVIGARLTSHIIKELGPTKCFFWSDSTTVLSWIKRNEPWGVFVFNRVREIRSLTLPENWHHVPGHLNPADLASRGCSPKALVRSQWWEGPTWLRESSSDWPSVEGEIDEEEILEEKRKTPILVAVNCPNTTNSHVFCKFAEFSRNVRVIAWMIRFLFNKYSKKIKVEGELTVREIDRAERFVFKLVQEESFKGPKDVILSKLKPRVGADGLIRLRTKIWARKDTEDFRSPIILPTNHDFVSKLVMETHKRSGHAMGQNLLNILRERYWIVRGRQAIKKIVAQCAICQRQHAKALEVESPPLPENRVRDAEIFEICGVDLAGPLFLSDGSKVWIALFTCAVFRAVHLEMVSSLSTEAFMLCFRRFVAIRGRPSIVYSDNGLNFRGTYNALQNIDWNKIVACGAVDRIEWRFNPPRAAWWGGFWERLVGVLKVVLRKVLGRASLNREELTTVVYECATYVNRRPLTYVSESPEDPVPITPQMFLQELPSNAIPELDVIDCEALKKRLRRRVALKEELRSRFRVEYLGQLNMASKGFREKRCPVIGELVLVGSDGGKRLDWPLAVVEEKIIGSDGKCRAVVLRTANGRLSRAIQHVFPLEISPSQPDIFASPSQPSLTRSCETTSTSREDGVEDDYSEEGPLQALPRETPEVAVGKKTSIKAIVEKVCKTRCGRKVKIPVKLDL